MNGVFEIAATRGVPCEEATDSDAVAIFYCRGSLLCDSAPSRNLYDGKGESCPVRGKQNFLSLSAHKDDPKELVIGLWRCLHEILIG